MRRTVLLVLLSAVLQIGILGWLWHDSVDGCIDTERGVSLGNDTYYLVGRSWVLSWLRASGSLHLQDTRLQRLPWRRTVPETLGSVPPDSWLLPDLKGIWIMADTRIEFYDRQHGLLTQGIFPARGEVSNPFFFLRHPAQVLDSDDGPVLEVWDTDHWRWITTCNLPPGVRVSSLRIVSHNDDFYFFYADHGAIHMLRGLPQTPGTAPWPIVCHTDGYWGAALLDGEPVVFRTQYTDSLGTLLADQKHGDQWQDVNSQGIDLLSRVGVYPSMNSGGFTVASQIEPGGAELDPWDLMHQEAEMRPDPVGWRQFRPRLAVGLSVLVLSPWLLAALCSLGRSGRSPIRPGGRAETRVAAEAGQPATPWRRARAHTLDAALVLSPGLWACYQVEHRLRMGYPTRLLPELHSAWHLAAGLALLFVVMEGAWTATPGQWFAGCRVVRLDGRPAGLLRALLRNALRIVDGLLGYLPALLVIGLGRGQRLGDWVCGTQVLVAADIGMDPTASEPREEPPLMESGHEPQTQESSS